MVCQAGTDGEIQENGETVFHYRNPVYAAMEETLDIAVGRVIDAVDDLGLSVQGKSVNSE
ncbi:MAG: hypothetical protein U5R06_10595 [candidate division KSB1 bacterium]|nr:hypothetical protein [candidate division KSB1 bacterium]